MKQIIPFATSGMSPIGQSASDLRPSAKGATVLEGKRFDANANETKIKAWLKSIA